jgi:hypothetical protein
MVSRMNTNTFKQFHENCQGFQRVYNDYMEVTGQINFLPLE